MLSQRWLWLRQNTSYECLELSDDVNFSPWMFNYATLSDLLRNLMKINEEKFFNTKE